MLLSEKGQTFHVNIDSDVQNVTAILACSEPLISPVLNVSTNWVSIVRCAVMCGFMLLRTCSGSGAPSAGLMMMS